MNGITEKRSWLNAWAYGLFWSWNLIFIAFMVLGFAPRVLPELITGVSTGMVPLNYLVYGLILSLIPVAAVILGVTVFRKEPARLLALGYVVEGPLMLLLAVRFFVVRQAPMGLTVMMVLVGLGMAAFLWQLLRIHSEPDGMLAGGLRLIGLTVMLFVSLYAAVWIAFYAIPLIGAAYTWLVDTILSPVDFLSSLLQFLRDILSGGWVWIPFSVLGLILVLYTLTLFALAPVVFPILSVRAWLGSLREQYGRQGFLVPSLLVTVTILASAALFVISNRQPQRRAFEMLSSPPQSQAEAERLLQKKEAIRAGLLNAYLAPFRYISAQGEVSHVRMIYEDVFDLSREKAFNVQRLYESVARPLLYEPVEPQEVSNLRDNHALTEEPQQAAVLYQRFFDEPITEGERDVLVRAARSTWSTNQAEAAWQAVDDREVHLLDQQVKIVEHGDWAEVEIFEAYQNQTNENQEVVYYFNLPESAVLTGLWLGTSPVKEESFVYQVAPRGAAQEVYRNETRRQQDPALLEQIGPRQYRLRVFPVPPLRSHWDEARSRTIVEEAEPLYVWMDYQTMAEGDAWPMPHMAFKMNVYWDEESHRSVNGQTMSAGQEDWLPASIPAEGIVQAVGHRVDLPGGESILVTPAGGTELPELPEGLRLAVVLDRSQSMADLSDEVTVALTRLRDVSAAEVDVYLTASPFRGEQPAVVPLSGVDPANILYFGGQNPAELLKQFGEMSVGQAYDAILVLTDDSGYELGASKTEPGKFDAPVWMVHLDSEIPLGYDDATLETIQSSGGGITGDLEGALTRLAFSRSQKAQGGDISADLVDGYLWQLVPTGQAEVEAPDVQPAVSGDRFAAFAARRLVLAEMQRRRGQLDDLETLDRIHNLAVNYGIVTPYSSMIVLVNAGQQYRLDNTSLLNDRFEREYENLGETTPEAPVPLAGVPEPHEWLLIALAVGLLVYFGYFKRPAPQTLANRRLR